MPACTFFGHSQCPDLRSELREAVMRLAGDGVDMFYVGDNGRFDAQVRSVLSELGLRYGVVLAYLPKGAGAGFDDTMFPEGWSSSIPATPLKGATSGCSSARTMS